MPDSYASANAAFLHPPKMLYRTNHIYKKKTVSGKNIATFGYSVSHLTGEVLTIEKIISHRKIITPIGEITFLQEILQMLQDFLKCIIIELSIYGKYSLQEFDSDM